jgi:hypothetical protein
MPITYTWTFPVLNAKVAEADKTNLVFNINWVCTGDDGEGHTANAYGSCSVPYNPDDAYVPFEQLTAAIVQGWLVENVGNEQISNIENYIATQIADQINPPIVALSPPWN